MDVLEIMSAVRSFSGLNSQSELGSNVLKRYVNIGSMYISQMLMPLYHEFLVKTIDYTNQSGTTISTPGDLLRIIEIKRESADDSELKVCGIVPVEERGLIDDNVNYESSEEHPFAVHEGRSLYFYPSLSTTDVRVRFRKRYMDLIFGKGTYASATTLTLGTDALPEDDVYNDYDLTIYQKTGNRLNLIGTYQITDYVGSTKIATLSGSSLSSVEYWYALVPILPEEFHNLLIDFAIANLKRAGKIKDDVSWSQDMKEIRQTIKEILQINFGQFPKRSGEHS